MDIKQLIGDGSPLSVLPQGLQDFIADYISGKVRQFVLCAELDEHSIATMIHIADDDNADMFCMVGALEVTKRDYMRMEIESLVEYKPLDDEGE